MEIRTTSSRAQGVITKALRYPLCTRDVLDAILRSPECPPAAFAPTPELPRRLFRGLSPRKDARWTTRDEPLPFLEYLYVHERIPRPNANAHEGYPLAMAVHAGFRPLAAFLLEHGADPARKNGLAVLVAIKHRDLGLVKMLIERGGASGTEEGPTPSQPQVLAAKRRRGQREESRPPNKRRRLEDRVQCSAEMLRVAVKERAMDIVQYLRDEKGCVPDMKTLQMMSL
jgi:hypothetical protein